MDSQAAVVRDAVGPDDPLVALTLGSIYAAAPTPPPKPRRPSPPTPPPSPPASATRRRLNDSAPGPRRRPGSDPPPCDADADADGKPAPFPWATERPARHHTLDSLLSRDVTSVEGEARCRRCNHTATVAYELAPKFREVREFVVANRHSFDDRAPDAWMNPVLPDCAACVEKRCMWPVIAAEKAEINWLFLLLGQMLGCCTLDQLKYFCKNTGRHRTGAKNRVLYYAFLEMCRQLEPRGPFDDTVADDNAFLHT
ncbi:hypothetical protein ZWY2020_004441 [Hordeum vulgare]|nr:hypothetical protein ZWY2020_004441 [Hordeum vulgare]